MALRSKISGDSLLLYFLITVLLILLSAIVYTLICTNPKGLRTLLEIEPKREILQFLGLAVGGVLIAIQALASYRRASALTDAVAAQTKVAAQQVVANEHTEHGQRQERLRNAIGHLGAASVSVRLGGAYQLYHLASDTEGFRRTVLDVLCAHIRHQTRTEEYRKAHRFEPSVEIQTLLTLLFVEGTEVFKGLQADLHRSYLVGSNLGNAHLEGANFTEINLAASLVRGAHLQGALLRSAYLHWSDLGDAHLQGAVLHQAHLQGAVLQNVEFQGAAIGGARMQASQLHGADFNGAKSWVDYVPFSQQVATGEVGRRKSTLGSRIPTFRERIEGSIGKGAQLDTTAFSGGVNEDDLDELSSYLAGQDRELFRRRMSEHVDQPVAYTPLDSQNISSGSYDKDQARTWINDYPLAKDHS